MSLADIGILLILLGGAVIFIANFIKAAKDKKIEMISEWLLLAVVQAEKELGNGTGQIKLRFVYDMFIAKFTELKEMLEAEDVDSMREMMRLSTRRRALFDKK